MQSTGVLTLALALLCGNVSAFGTNSFARTPMVRPARSSARSALVMEDFGLMKGSKLGFEELWGGNPVISEAATEVELNKVGLRYRMNRNKEEADEIGPLGFDIELGPIKLRAPRVASIWEALGFTATSNNEARQAAKMAASENASKDPLGKRTEYLGKYGYPRLVGTKGIFYADQLSSDKKPMGGFGMKKSGVMWPVPPVVEEGAYGGSAGWGGKKKGKGKK